MLQDTNIGTAVVRKKRAVWFLAPLFAAIMGKVAGGAAIGATTAAVAGGTITSAVAGGIPLVGLATAAGTASAAAAGISGAAAAGISSAAALAIGTGVVIADLATGGGTDHGNAATPGLPRRNSQSNTDH